MCNMSNSSGPFHNSREICDGRKHLFLMYYRLLRIALLCAKKAATKTMGDPPVCYQASVARLTVLAASTMNASDPAAPTGERFITLLVP